MTIYSYSRLRCFEQCPQKYKFQYVDKVKMEVRKNIEIFLGKRVHETLKKLYLDLRYGKFNTLEELLEFLCDGWTKNWYDSIRIVKEGYGPEEYLRIAEKCIIDFYNRYKPFNQGKTIGLEERIIINLDDYKLCGYIDRLTETEKGCYEIHDYKTCSKLPSLEIIKNDRQLAIYSIGVKQIYPYVKDVRLIWHFLKFDKEIYSTRSDNDLDELKKNTIQLIDIIENAKEFPANYSMLCDWCKFKPVCM
jgi:putative RecB family exonuclease